MSIRNRFLASFIWWMAHHGPHWNQRIFTKKLYLRTRPLLEAPEYQLLNQIMEPRLYKPPVSPASHDLDQWHRELTAIWEYQEAAADYELDPNQETHLNMHDAYLNLAWRMENLEEDIAYNNLLDRDTSDGIAMLEHIKKVLRS